jgi:hypothetical protein
MPVTASVTAAVVPDAVSADGRVGLAFVQAVVTASSASALQIPSVFNFICSYRGLDRETAKTKIVRDEGWETRLRL